MAKLLQHVNIPVAWPYCCCITKLPGPPRDVHEVRNAFRGGRFGMYNAHRRVVRAEHPRRTPREAFGRGKIPGVVAGGLNRTACIL
jgi:hypothetical protein